MPMDIRDHLNVRHPKDTWGEERHDQAWKFKENKKDWKAQQKLVKKVVRHKFKAF